MTSGQCTIGAMTNVSSCEPVLSVSPSLTVMICPLRSAAKNWPIMVFAFAPQTMVTPG